MRAASRSWEVRADASTTVEEQPAPPIAAAPSTAARPGIVRVDATSDLWWKNAVVYCVDIKTFLDYDGEGVATSRA